MSNELSHEWLEAELVIGLVCPVGAESMLVVQVLTETLNRAGYDVRVIKVSKDIIPAIIDVPEFKNQNFERYDQLMTAGNKCRELADDDSILALGAALEISRSRGTLGEKGGAAESTSGYLPRTAFIIDSLKRPEEVDALRIIYPTGFLLIGVHEEEVRRGKHLIETKGMSKDDAQKLISRDRDEANTARGQKVNKTFHLADCFVQLTGNSDRLRCDVRRIVELCFGNPFLTPTFDELAMFQAFAAALRSADLSRQVGAVVARDQQILATGANDCPKAGGGLYWPERDPASGCICDQPRGRDFRRGRDSNRTEQREIVKRLAERLSKEVFNLSEQQLEEILDASEIRGLTEYGRVVHAEMEALLSCARQGISTRGAELYSTTFPCHNCAKHIIAAGVRRVVYVEPYAKSKALEFHDDSILTPEGTFPIGKPVVRFEPFVGIGPRRFFELFSMHLGSSYPIKRKESETGEKVDWDLSTARLRLQMKPVSYLHFEQLAGRRFSQFVANQATENQDDS